MKGYYPIIWPFILSYIGVTIIFPIVTNFLLIKTNYSEICDKYKESKCCKFNCYSYIELVDIVKQIAYVIAAEYDVAFACIAIEAFWFILIIITRPYQNISDYSLAFGSSLVLFLANGGAIYMNYNGNGFFSFKLTVIFVIIACVPAIVSAYLFFIFDFNGKIEDSDSTSINDNNLKSVFLISLIVAPLAWLVFGTNLPSLLEEVEL